MTEQDRTRHPGDESFDVVIIGGGAAGLSAALVLARARRRVCVIDDGRPRNAPAGHLHGYLGRDGLPPAALLELGREEARSYGATIVPATVTTVSGSAGTFTAQTDDGARLDGRRLVVATGAADRLPEIPGLRQRWGRDVLHCPYCHGREVADRPLGLLGDDSGLTVGRALLLRQWSEDVTYLLADGPAPSDGDAARLDAAGIRVVPGAVVGLEVDDDALSGVRLADGAVVPLAAMFLVPRLAPRAEFLSALAPQYGRSEIATWLLGDPTGLTSVPGVWAAGNVADPTADLIVSAAAGSRAAMAINVDLVADPVAPYTAVRAG